jgi:CheY-like chemotaxis protein
MRANPLPQLRILVVDDEETVRDTLKMLLEFDRHLVEAAGSGHRALEMFQPGKFDLIITDYDMPGMKGDYLAAAIKGVVPAQPVVMVTAYAEAIKNDPSLLRHLDGVVPKPFRIETLRAAIAHAIAGRRPPQSSAGP